MPRSEFDDLATLSVARGFSMQPARVAAEGPTERDAFTAELDVELGTDLNASPNPWQGAIASAIACPLGAVIPIVAILLLPSGFRVFVPFAAVFVLVLAGVVSAALRRYQRGMGPELSGTVGYVSRRTLSTGTPVGESWIHPAKYTLGGA
ncbi:MAG: VIT1/CCC1 transporter family protein [Mycobacterium sp.]